MRAAAAAAASASLIAYSKIELTPLPPANLQRGASYIYAVSDPSLFGAQAAHHDAYGRFDHRCPYHSRDPVTAKAQKCAHIVKEIVETEDSYLHGLRTCLTVFMEPLSREAKENPKTALVPPEKIGHLFGNMPVRALPRSSRPEESGGMSAM